MSIMMKQMGQVIEMALIYVVEDDKNIREIEVFALRNTGYEIKDFECAKEFYQEMEEKKPDIILLDIMLPDEDGLDIVRKLRSGIETKDIPIILVTAKTSEIDKVKGLDIGADDYMAKPFGVMELISRVKALLRRSNKNEEKILYIGKVCLDEEKHMVTADGIPCELTYKEYELLKLLMNNAGIVTPRDLILEKIWGTDFEGESRTLDMHIKTLRQKLKEAGSMIKTVRNVGYMFTT
nr:response regulator transcription factor [Kineothrix alysoides]